MTTTVDNKLVTSPENAQRFAQWIESRGGVAVWYSQDLSAAGRSYSTPATREDGTPATAPHWSTAKQPDKVYTDIEDIAVEIVREVKTIRAGLAGNFNTGLRLTYAARERIEKTYKQLGADNHWHELSRDGRGTVAVFFTRDRLIPLAEFLQSLPSSPENTKA